MIFNENHVAENSFRWFLRKAFCYPQKKRQRTGAVQDASAPMEAACHLRQRLGVRRPSAVREIGLNETARVHQVPFDPTRKQHLRILGTDKHQVTLETPWRNV